MIHNFPSHIYHSALPLCPSSSWLHEHYSVELSREVKMIRGLPAEWGACFRIVSFDYAPQVLAYWNNVVVVGLGSHDHNIVILDATTGSQMSVLSGHTGWVRSLTFSSDGKSFVSGGDDKIIKLWDTQTGGVAKTFYGHSSSVTSISISPPCDTIISGSWDGTIRIWDVQTGECLSVILAYNHKVATVSFSPREPQHLVSASEDGIVKHWSIDGHEIGFTYGGYYAAFSSQGTYSVSCEGRVITVRESDSGGVVAKLHSPADNFNNCCFSPDEKFVAGAASGTIYIWNITTPAPHLITTFVGHTSFISSLVFSSSLISASSDRTVKFWQASGLLTDPVTTSPIPIPLNSASVESVNVQADDGIAISSDSTGVVKVWDISTGLCKASFMTPAKGKRDIQQIGGSLVTVWYDWRIGAPGKVHVWDVEKGEAIWTLGQSWSRALDLKISGDGSQVFLLDYQSIQAWSISTGEPMGEVKLKGKQPQGLIVNGSRVWLSYSEPTVHSPSDPGPVGWDFGIPDCPSIPPPNTFPDRPCFTLVDGTIQKHAGSSWVEDTVTGRQIFYLPKRLAINSRVSHWDKQYLVLGHHSGEILILNFSHVYPK